MQPIIIFGAGKIGRGFINHLLYLSGLAAIFIDQSQELCRQLNEQGRYTVKILGSPEKNCTISPVQAVCLDEQDRVLDLIAAAGLIFTAVGGKNLPSIAPLLARGFSRRLSTGSTETLNIITCENWHQPAAELKRLVSCHLPESEQKKLMAGVGFSEAVIMRSAIDPGPGESDLNVNVQDYWELPVDASGLAGPLPPIRHLAAMDRFDRFLERKFYTYNAANATVSYLGALLGYTQLAEAVRDPFIHGVLEKVYAETAAALCRKLNLDPAEQASFVDSSRQKLHNRQITDTVERNARDPLRKLAVRDRLVGPALLIWEQGVCPDGILTALACAIFYPAVATDPAAIQLAEMRKKLSISRILQQVCSLEPDHPLHPLVLERIRDLQMQAVLPQEGRLTDEN